MECIEKLSEKAFAIRFSTINNKLIDRILHCPVNMYLIKSSSRDLIEWKKRKDIVCINLSKIHDIILHNNKSYIIGQYIDGVSLNNIFVTPTNFWKMASNLLKALHCLHSCGLTHGAITSDNIFVLDTDKLSFVLVGDGMNDNITKEIDIEELGWVLVQKYRSWDNDTMSIVRDHSKRSILFSNGNCIERFLSLLTKTDDNYRLTTKEALEYIQYYNSNTG